MNGVCSPPSHVKYDEKDGELISRLGDFTINRAPRGTPMPYPTLCKGRFRAGAVTGHIFEDPSSLDASELIPQLVAANVTAFKIEGRQRSRSYIGAVVRAFSAALDAQARGAAIPAGPLAALSEGGSTTRGAYQKTWR
jgi:putative protease